MVSQTGSVLLDAEAIRKSGLDRAIFATLAPSRKLQAVHDPGKILVDLAPAVALSGDCHADVVLLRSRAGWVRAGRLRPDCLPADRHPYRLGREAADRLHGPGGTGEPVAALLRPGDAGSNTAVYHIAATRLALARPPKKYRRGRRTLIRCDSSGGTHEFVAWLAQRGYWLSYSGGMVITEAIHQHILKFPRRLDVLGRTGRGGS